MASATTMGGGGHDVTLTQSLEHTVMLARELAGAIKAQLTPSFLGGSSLESLQAALGNESLGGSLGEASVGGALSKAVVDLAKVGAAVLTDFTKVAATPAVTVEEPKAAGTASTITLSDATKITFTGVSDLNSKTFH